MNNCYISPVNFMKCIFCLVSKYLSIDLIGRIQGNMNIFVNERLISIFQNVSTIFIVNIMNINLYHLLTLDQILDKIALEINSKF